MGGATRSRSANGHRCHPQGFRGCHKGATLPSCKDSLSRLQDLSLIKRATATTARLTHDQAGKALRDDQRRPRLSPRKEQECPCA